jgi:hypothetical protein
MNDIMWTQTVEVRRTERVDASPERAWELAGSLAALSAHPGWFAFGVPAGIPGADRVCCVIHAKPLWCHVLDVREEEPGRMISWQVRSRRPLGSEVLTLSVLAQRTGCALRIVHTNEISRVHQPGDDSSMYRQAGAWIRRLRAIAEGRAPWPQAAMPEEIRRKCVRRPPLKKPADVSAAVLISAPASAVWECVQAPLVLPTTPGVILAGHVPGTPEQEAGEMQYFLWRLPDDGLSATVNVIRESSLGRTLVHVLAYPHDEDTYLVDPELGGTRLKLVHRWSNARNHGQKRDAATEARRLQATADAYKATIEAAAGPHDNQLCTRPGLRGEDPRWPAFPLYILL